MPYYAKKATAITDDLLLHRIGLSLKNNRIENYLLYWLLIETGATSTYLLTIKVADIRDKTTIKIPNRQTVAGVVVTRDEKISESLKDEITEYTQDKKDSDNLFPYDYTYFVFNTALKKACEVLRIEPINATHLKKTYYYRQYLIDRDIKKIKRRLCHITVEETWDFLGIPNLDVEMPSKDFEILDNIPINYVLSIKDATNSSLTYIEESVSSKNKPIATYHVYAEYLASLEVANRKLKDSLTVNLTEIYSSDKK